MINVCYNGFGFPVELKKVTLVNINGEWTLKMDVKKVASKTIENLAYQKDRLTGNQIRFIRVYLNMSLRDFAKELVNESRTAVNKWEKCGDEETNMDINIEKVLRLNLLEQVFHKNNPKKTFYDKFYKLFSDLKKLSTNKKNTTKSTKGKQVIHA